MNVLLHTCCGPCAIHPTGSLRAEGMDVTGFFYRHNIHPYTEMRRREEALARYAEIAGLEVIYQEGYDLEGFLRGAVFHEGDRCAFCFRERLHATALAARQAGFEAFTSSLLYSRHQPHDRIRETGEAVAEATGVAFLYRNFRKGWQEGVDASRRLGLYRQPYCGCIYSEKERYLGRPRKTNTRGG